MNELDDLLRGNEIRGLDVTRNAAGQIRRLSVGFGPHHFLVLEVVDDLKVNFTLGATHHGLTFDASTVNGELEQVMRLMSTVCKPENRT